MAERTAEDPDDAGDLIRKQHRRAFEIISAALRVDEDEKGARLHMFTLVYTPHETSSTNQTRPQKLDLRGDGSHVTRHLYRVVFVLTAAP